MIQLIEAPPRSGKSYFAVNYLCKFTKYDALYHEFVLQDSVLIISNIEGLKINHWKLSECLKKQSMQEFFSIANFEKIMSQTGKTRVIIAIDEVHELFPAGYKDPEIYNFFAYHGHIGLDIILMTQSLDATTRLFNPLLEYVVKVTPRSRAVFKHFSYSYYTVKGTFLYSKSLQKSQMVFRAYKSFRQDEHQKPKNAVKQWLIVTLVFFLVAGGLFKSALAIVAGKSEKARIQAENSEQIKKNMAATHSKTFTNVSSAKIVAVPPSLPIPVHAKFSSAAASFDPSPLLPRVVGYVGVVGGKNAKYLLSTGQILQSSRKLDIGDVFIK